MAPSSTHASTEVEQTQKNRKFAKEFARSSHPTYKVANNLFVFPDMIASTEFSWYKSFSARACQNSLQSLCCTPQNPILSCNSHYSFHVWKRWRDPLQIFCFYRTYCANITSGPSYNGCLNVWGSLLPVLLALDRFSHPPRQSGYFWDHNKVL